MNGLAGHHDRPRNSEQDWRYFSAEQYTTSSAASASEADLEADVETEGLDFEYDDNDDDDDDHPNEPNEPLATQLPQQPLPPALRQQTLRTSRGTTSTSSNNNSNHQENYRSTRLSAVATSLKGSNIAGGQLFSSYNNPSANKEADDSTDTIKNLRARALDKVNRRGSTTLDGEGGTVGAVSGAGGLVRKSSSSMNSSPRVGASKALSDDSPRGLRRISDNVNERSSLGRQSSFRTLQQQSQSQQQQQPLPSQGSSRLMRYESQYQKPTSAQDQQRGGHTTPSARYSLQLQHQGLGLLTEDDSQSESTLTRVPTTGTSLTMERSRRLMMDELKSLKARVEELELERMSRSLSVNGNMPLPSPALSTRPQAADLRAEQDAVASDEREGGGDGAAAYREDKSRGNKHNGVSSGDSMEQQQQYHYPLRSPVSSRSLKITAEQDVSPPATTLSRQSSIRTTKEHTTSAAATNHPHSRQPSVAQRPDAFISTQHVELLKDAFDFFEKTINHSAELVPTEHAIPSVQGMARIVSHALSMNQTIRTWVKADVSLVESSSMQALLRASDDQIRSLTESLLSTANLIAELEAASSTAPVPASVSTALIVSAPTSAPVMSGKEPAYVAPSSPLLRSSSASIVSRSPGGSATASGIYRSASMAGGHSTLSLGGYTSAGEDRGGPVLVDRGKEVRRTWHPSGYESAGSVSSFGQAAAAVASLGHSNSAAHFRALQEPAGLRQGYASDFSHDRNNNNGSFMSSGSSAMVRSGTLPARQEARITGSGYVRHRRPLCPQGEESDLAEQQQEEHRRHPQQHTQRRLTLQQQQQQLQLRNQGAISPRLSQVAREKRFSGIEQRLDHVQSPTDGNFAVDLNNAPNTAVPSTKQQHDSVRRQASVRQLLAKYSANSPTSIFFNTTTGTAGYGSVVDCGQQGMQTPDLTIERNMQELLVQEQYQQQLRHEEEHPSATLRRNRIASEGRISDLHLAQPTLIERRTQMQQECQQQQQGQHTHHHQQRPSSDWSYTNGRQQQQRQIGGGRYTSVAQSMVELQQHADMQMTTPAISSASSSPSSSRVDGQSLGSSQRVMTPDNGAVVLQQALSPRGKSSSQQQQQHYVYKMGHPSAEMATLQQQKQQQYHHRLTHKATLQ